MVFHDLTIGFGLIDIACQGILSIVFNDLGNVKVGRDTRFQGWSKARAASKIDIYDRVPQAALTGFRYGLAVKRCVDEHQEDETHKQNRIAGFTGKKLHRHSKLPAVALPDIGWA